MFIPLLKPHRMPAAFLHLYVASTERCGLGLFTARPWREGETVMAQKDRDYFANACSYEEITLRGYTHREIFQVGENLFIPPSGNIDDFTNHCCDPNTGIRLTKDGFEVIALGDILPGEEITYDYSTYQDRHEEDMACLCSARFCRGVVRSFKHLPHGLQRYYLERRVVAPFNEPYVALTPLKAANL
jgi:hypothetical protein